MKKYLFYSILSLLILVVSCKKEDSPTTPSEFGSVSGTVLSQTDDTPIGFVRVFTEPSTSVVSSNEVGMYQIENIEPGEYTVTAIKLGFDTLTVGVNVSAGATSVADFMMAQSDTIANQKFGIIKGALYNSETGTVIPYVSLSTLPSTSIIRSDAAGKFTFTNLLPGSYTIVAEKIGYNSGSKSVQVTAGLTTISELELTPKDTVSIQVKGNLSGTIINSVTEQPIKNALVSTVPSFGSVLTDSNGQYSILDLPEGDYQVSVSKTNYDKTTSSISIVGGKDISANFVLVPSVGSLSGVVLDSLGSPLKLVEITTSPETSSYTTNESGQFTINNMAIGNFTLNAAKLGYVTKDVDIIIEAGKTTQIEIVLYKN